MGFLIMGVIGYVVKLSMCARQLYEQIEDGTNTDNW